MKYSNTTKQVYLDDTPAEDLPQDAVDISNDEASFHLSGGRKWSPTKRGFHLPNSSNCPVDAIDLDFATYKQLLDDNAAGLQIVADENGQPTTQQHDPTYWLNDDDSIEFNTKMFIENFNDDNINNEPDQSDLDNMSVDHLIKVRSTQLRSRFDHAMNWILNSYTEAEIDGWSEQKKDADIWVAHRAANPSMTDDDVTTYNDTPMLKEAAKGRENKDDVALTVADMDNYKDAIISKSGFFRPYSGGLVGIKKRLMKVIDDIPKDENGLADFSGEADPAQAEADAITALKALDTSEILAAGYAFIVANS
jgi:hypothetical protein